MASDLDLPGMLRDTAWWLAEDPNASGSMVSAIVKRIRSRNRWRYDADCLHASMYAGNSDAGGVLMTPDGDFDYTPSTRPRNISRMAVDTFVSKIVKHKPLPKVQTVKGNYSQQKRAKKATQWEEGAFYMARFFEEHDRNWVRDSGVYGKGIIKQVRVGKNNVGIEHLFPWELLFDDWDARKKKPRNAYEMQTLDYGVALAKYGKPLSKDEDEMSVSDRIGAIKRSATSDPRDDWTWEGECDSTVMRVRFVESYHLCDDVDAHRSDEDHECTGRHDVTLLGGPRVFRRTFTWDLFPHEVLQYTEPMAGMHGIGLPETLEGWQEAIDTGRMTLEECCRMLGGGLIIVDSDSDIPNVKFQNGGIGILRRKRGTNVEFAAPSPVNPMLYQRDKEMPQEALGEVGFSPMSTQAVRPPGITSGVGLNMLDDIEDERRLPQGLQREHAINNMARKWILLAKEIAEEEGELEVQVPMANGLLPLKWSEVSLDDFQLRVFPASWLPQTPAAKIEVLNFLLERGAIDVDEFRRLFGGPDYEWELDLKTADRLNTDEKLEAICEAEGKDALRYAMSQATPNNYQDPTWALARAQQRYNRGQIDGMPEENQNALRQYMNACKAVIEANTPKPDPMMGPPPAGMGAVPLEPPPGAGPPMPPGMPPPGMAGPPPDMNGAPPMGGIQ